MATIHSTNCVCLYNHIPFVLCTYTNVYNMYMLHVMLITLHNKMYVNTLYNKIYTNYTICDLNIKLFCTEITCICEYVLSAINWHLPFTSARIKSCDTEAADLQHH